MQSSCSVLRVVIVLLMTVYLSAGPDGQPLTNEHLLQLLGEKMSTNIIVKTITSAAAIRFDTSPAALIALKKAGATDALIEVVLDVARARGGGAAVAATLHAAEKSETLRNSKHPGEILRTFQTMYVNASNAQFFGNAQMKGALGDNAGFRDLGVAVVEDRAVADTVLEVSYTFAWDYPFTLKHQNSSVVLVSGKGHGPFSGPAGASSVARELVKLLKPFRSPQTFRK